MKRIDGEVVKKFSKKINAAEENSEIPSVSTFIDGNNFNNPFVGTKLKEVCKFFFYAWKDLNAIRSDETLTRMINYIFNNNLIIRDIGFIHDRIHLTGKKILDTGCCWGSLAYFLKNIECDISCIDYVESHAMFTKFLLPQIDVYHGDVRDMSMLEDNCFDLIVSRGVIEHVGDYSLPRGGSSVESIVHQRQYIREMKRVVKKGGYIWISTGNFSFPYDGEIEQWFFHWLPEEFQNIYLSKANEGADKYWLLTWKQLKEIFEEFSLSIEDVVCPDIDMWRDFISDLFRHHGRHKDILIPMIMEQMSENPSLMPNWMITLKS